MLFVHATPGSVRVVRHRRRLWAVRFEGDPDPVFIYRTQALAIAHGLALARDRRCDLVVQNSGACRRRRNRYDDQFPSRT
jgi:hypothetical protein